MYCDDCGHELDPSGKCPICGWQSPNSVNKQQNIPNGQGQPDMYGQPQMHQQGQPNMYAQSQMGQQRQPNMYGQPQMHQQGQPNIYSQSQMGQQRQPNMYAQSQMGQQGQPNMYSQSQMGQQRQSNMYGQPQMRQQGQPNNFAAPKKKKWPIFVFVGIGIVVLALVTAIIIKLNEPKDYTKNTTEIANDPPSEHPTTDEPSTEPVVSSGEKKDKTIMVYMVGSDLESKHSAASSDIDEMLDADLDDDINLLIYTGGCSNWHNSDIPEDANSTIMVNEDDLTLLESTSEKNMGDPDTLADFLTYGYDNYPADEYSVVLWNHGGGAILGYGFDEVSQDNLTLEELEEAFAASPFTEDNKLEWIGFDACLMATIETANALAPYANYLIASQESEPGWGWDYNFISEIDDLSGGEAVGKEIADSYIDTCEQNFIDMPYSHSNVTLSVMDLSKAEAAEEALNNLYAQANSSLTADSYGDYSHARVYTKEIASEFTGEYSYDLIDLKDLSLKMKSLHPAESQALAAAIDELVVYNKANEPNANGVSIYHPYNAKEYSSYYIPIYQSFNFAPNYTAYITSFTQLLTNADTLTASWDVASMVPTSNGDMTFSLQLTPEQAAVCQKAYFVISRADENNPSNYVFVAMGNDVTIDGSNVATANFDGNIIYMQNDTTMQQYEVMYTIQEKTDTYTRYLLSSILFDESIEEEDAMYAYFVMDVSAEHPGGELIGTYPIANLVSGDTSNPNLYPERYEIDIYDYQNIAFGSLSHEFTSEEDLTNFNEADWNDLVLHYNTQAVTDGFSTVSGSMIDGIPYFGMFIFEDTQGNRHCSNLVQIQ